MSVRAPGPAPDLPGFRYVEHLGTGGFADVFKYEQLGLGRQVAVKVLLDNAELDVHASFEVEASVMAQLSNHPSIVSIYQAGTTPDGRPFLVMEYCPPPHLALRLRARPLSVAKAIEVAIHLGGAVETAHRLGILHRDIKPANILFTEFGRAALTDFGISVTTSGARSGEGVGMSVPWAPPEQLSLGSPMGPTGDVYALAATLWTALVGRSPFHVVGGANDAVAMAARVRSTPVPPTRRPDVPESLERAIRTAMAKSPDERYESALVFARTLQSIQAELHQPMTQIDVLDENVDDLGPAEDAGGTRISGFVSIDPEAPGTTGRPAGSWSFTASPEPPPPPDPGLAPAPGVSTAPTSASAFGSDQQHDPETLKKSADPPAYPTAPPPTEPRPEPTGGRSVSLPVVVAAAVVVGGVGGAVWLGTRAGDATEDNGGEQAPPAAVDPIGDAPPAPTQVKVTRLADGRLSVRWHAREVEPGDTYVFQVVKDRAGQDEVVVPAADPVAGTSVSVEAEGGNCVEVRTLRGAELSPWSDRGCAR